MHAVFERKRESYTPIFIAIVGYWAQLLIVGCEIHIGMNRRTLSKRDVVGARVRIWAGDLLLYNERKGGKSYQSAQYPRCTLL